jgi:hypothetical protein
MRDRTKTGSCLARRLRLVLDRCPRRRRTNHAHHLPDVLSDRVRRSPAARERNYRMMRETNTTEDQQMAKNPHARALGRLGGLIGGKATSTKKARAARENGKQGGRPKKKR